MPTVSQAQLKLTTIDDNVTLDVTYTAGFSQFERRLAGLGLIFREQIAVVGVDPAGSTTGSVLFNFPVVSLPVTDGAGAQSLLRNRSVTILRSSLQEDAAPGDNDEIRCRIRIASVRIPPAVTPDAFTDQEVLLG